MDTPDTHETDALESLEISAGYRLVVERVKEMIEHRRNGLERQAVNYQGPDSIEHMQGYIAACRTFLTLPAILREEIRRGIETRLKEKR